MIQRNPDFYTNDLLKSTYPFDGKEYNYSKTLIDYFNQWVRLNPDYKDLCLELKSARLHPNKIIWVDASQDKLPATRESCRVTGSGVVVNNRKELLNNLKDYPSESLVLSQCVKKECYNVDLSKKIQDKGSIACPGPVTAPGSLFSDKLKTYNLLSENRKEWDLIPKYFKISVERRNPLQVAEEILKIIDKDRDTNNFFIKPIHGGGGLGGFRLMRVRKKGKTKYIVPDLSRVSGEFKDPHIMHLTVNPKIDFVIDELWWLYNRFKSINVLKKNYIDVDIKSKSKLKKLLKKKFHKEYFTREEAKEKIGKAIEKFEQKFNKRYCPLVNHYIDFGTWGLRAHYRITRKGIQIETIYGRLFQIRFENDGIGYVGSDNISNKQTGELELGRLVPVNKIMVRAIGGEERLNNILLKGCRATKKLVNKLPEELRKKVPIRVQYDLAPVSGLIGEGNADTARGFCLAQNFDQFAANIKEWFNDSLNYYGYIKSKR
ncbi:MAG: hypothetical protein ACOC5R_02035 [Elusimicrobiota bacterium]